MSFRCGSFSPVVVRNFLSRKPPGLESVCIRSSRITTWPWGSTRRVTGIIHTEGQPQTTALHHRDAQRHDAVRRLTSLLFACLSHLAERFFFILYFSFFFFIFLFSLLRTSIQIYHRIDMPIHLGSWPRILQPSDDIFVSRPSRHRVDVASRRLFVRISSS